MEIYAEFYENQRRKLSKWIHKILFTPLPPSTYITEFISPHFS